MEESKKSQEIIKRTATIQLADEDINKNKDVLSSPIEVRVEIDIYDLATELEVEIEKLLQQEPEIGEAVHSILIANLKAGRIKKFFSSRTEDTLEDYIQRVVFYYKKNQEYVSSLQLENVEVWAALLKKLRRWAYSFLKRKGVQVRDDLNQIAKDCANETGARLAKIRFPYDVDYDSWALRVTQLVCYSYIRRDTEKLDYVGLNLSEMEEWLQALSKPDYSIQADKRMDLIEAIEKLGSEDRRKMINLYYFEGKSFNEIAEYMGRTSNAIYKLHFDALENLRMILQESSYNIETSVF